MFFLHPQSLLFVTHSFTHFAVYTFYCLLFLFEVSFISWRTGTIVLVSFCSSNDYSSRVVSISMPGMPGMPDVFSATSMSSLLWKPPPKHAHAKPGMPDVLSAASKAWSLWKPPLIPLIPGINTVVLIVGSTPRSERSQWHVFQSGARSSGKIWDMRELRKTSRWAKKD